jgi:Mn2+/Fe2+ NRAMP family transporter
MLAVAEAPFFYATFIGILTIGAAVVLVPGVAVLLFPLLLVMQRLARDRDLMGQYRNGRRATLAAAAAFAIVAASVVGLGIAVLAGV